MKRSQALERGFKGEITAFASLLFLVMLSLIAAIFESAYIHIEKHQNCVDMNMALESVFAEYHRDLLEEYGIFARVGSDEESISSRLGFYGAGHMDHEIEQICLLTDAKGMSFYEQAVQYEKEAMGLSDFSFGSDFDFDQESDTDLEDVEKRIAQEDATLPEDNNPIWTVQNLKKKESLALFLSDSSDVSNKSIVLSELPSKRSLSKGNWKEVGKSSLSDRAFFAAYVKEHFSSRVETKEERVLDYEMEYLIGGKGSDRENLSVVCKRILQIRMVANYGYLLTDSAKRAEAKTMATALSTLMEAPALAGILEQGILLAWAYGEGIVDVRGLLKGNRVPLIKTSDTWQLQLSNLATIGTSNEVTGEKNSKEGLSYEDYLTGLLLLEKTEKLSMRSLDLIESNLQIKTDQCITKIQIKSEAKLRRNVLQKFTTKFGYR